MFGYVRPYKSELKVREFEEFNAIYCGLCHTLGKRYGFLTRMLLNYDFTFLALVLDSLEPVSGYHNCRCVARPFRKKRSRLTGPVYEAVADQCVILTWWKLRDDIDDKTFIRGLGARFLSFWLKPAYKKAAERFESFDETVRQNIKRLQRLEEERSAMLDQAADTFALILMDTVSHIEPEETRRPLQQMLYHIGRWIYLSDARDDLKSDFEDESYNPLIERFHLTGPKLSGEQEKYLETTAMHSAGLAADAFELIEFDHNKELIGNIILMGLPAIWRQIVSEAPRKKKNRIGVAYERSI